MRIVTLAGKISIAATTVGLALAVTAGPALAVSVPYSDPAATGQLGFCDASNHPVTSGSVTATPLAQTAVGSLKAPAGYDVPGQTATLFAYQPRPGVPAGEFSGLALTAASRYTNSAHPMAGITALDQSLADFMQSFPVQDKGFLQLRLYLGAPDQPIYKQTYSAANLQITGNTWTLVGGATPDCTAGTYTTVESILLPSQLAAAQSSAAHPGSPAGTTSPGSEQPGTSAGSSPSPSGTAGSHSSRAASPEGAHADASRSTSTSAGPWIAALAVLLGLGGGGAWAFARHRRVSARR